MYGICCVPFFFFEKPLVKNTFFKSFPKKPLRLWISKIRIWILIRRIHPECGFYGFMDWICPNKRKIRFWIRKSGFSFSQKKTQPKCRYFYLSVHVVVELSGNIMGGNWGFRSWPKNALLWQITRNQNLVGMDQAVDTLRNTVAIPEGQVWAMVWAWF